MRVLLIGDIVGSPGRKAIESLLGRIKEKEAAEFVIANGENAAAGSGITPGLAKDLFRYGVDVITSGDHIWKRKEMVAELDAEKRLLRPANYPAGVPGYGWGIYPAGKAQIGVINLVGRVFMEAVECPFRTAKAIVEEMRKTTKTIFIDMHAEATSEKIALGWYLDGLVSGIVGTHTHVQTADEHIYPKGTAFICDVGMTGPHDSVIGRKAEQIIARFITQLPTKFEMAEDNIMLNGVVIDVDTDTGLARSIKRVSEKL